MRRLEESLIETAQERMARERPEPQTNRCKAVVKHVAGNVQGQFN